MRYSVLRSVIPAPPMPAPVLRERYMAPRDDHSAFVWVESVPPQGAVPVSLLGERDDGTPPPNPGSGRFIGHPVLARGKLSPNGTSGPAVPERYPATACVRSSYDPSAQVISHRLPSGSAMHPE